MFSITDLASGLVTRTWLFTCDYAVTPVLAVVVGWLEDHAWLGNPRKRVMERLQNTMMSTEDYTMWSKCAERLDRMNGYDNWRYRDDSSEYDWRTMRSYVEMAHSSRVVGDVSKGMHLLASWPHRSASGLLTDATLKYLTGTKKLVEEYYEEVELLLQQVVKSPSIPAQAKYVFFKRIAQNHGRTALMLSGGASLGMYHLGVMKALWQADLLPKVITGSSAGSIVAAFVCSRSHAEIDEMFWTDSASAALQRMNISLDAFDPFGPRRAIRRMLWRVLVGGSLMDVGRLAECIKFNIGDITFIEAYERSGRVLSVTVTSTREFQTTLVLNYLTAPNVVVRTAVCASCAVSGIFTPVELLAKNAQGEIVPYCPSRQQWCDGSINMDLPIKRISELFNINYIIVSQVNPHVIPFLDTSDPRVEKGLVTRMKILSYGMLCTEMKHLALQAYRMGLVPAALGPLAKMLEQNYAGGNVNIFPVTSVSEVLVSLQNPTTEFMEHCISEGQRRTWPYLNQIRYHTHLEQTLDECFNRIVLGLMTEYERISSRPIEEGSPSIGCRQDSILSNRGSNSSAHSEDLEGTHPLVRPWTQEPVTLWDSEEAEDDEQNLEKVRKLRDSRYVLERLHTFHPTPTTRRSQTGRSQCGSSVVFSNNPSILELVKPLRSATDLPADCTQPFNSKQLPFHNNQTMPEDPPLGGMTLPGVLSWIEEHVGPEHKLTIAQYAVRHAPALAAIIQSAFDQKEALMLEMARTAP